MFKKRKEPENVSMTFVISDAGVFNPTFSRRPKTNEKPRLIPEISRVIFNDPATIVIWKDGTKTVSKVSRCDKYSPETGLMACISKKALGSKKQFRDTFKQWLPEKDGECYGCCKNVQVGCQNDADTAALLTEVLEVGD